MPKREIGTRLKLDGEAEYNASIRNINQTLQVLNSEMAATTSAFDRNNASISDLRAKGEIYNKQLEAQQQKLEIYNRAVQEAQDAQKKAADELAELTERYGANSEEVQKAERRLAAVTATLNDYQIRANFTVRSINQLEAAQRSNNEAIAQMENSVDDAEQAINRYDEALDDAGQSVIDFGDLVKANLASDLISSAFEKATEKSSKELLAMAERVGFSAEAYQEWDYIAKQAGTTMETLQGGITDLAEKMDDAASGTGEAAEIFEQLGLSVTDTTGNLKDQEQMFTEVVLALQNVEDASKRQALATKLMSTTGEELLPLLNGQIGSIDELKRSAHEMGAVLSDTALNDMAAMENSFENLETKGINAATALVSNAAPALSKMSDIAVENTDAILALIAAYVSFTGANAIGNGIMTLVNSIKQLKTANDAATASQTAMNAATNANPYILLASALAAVVGGIVVYNSTVETATKQIKELKEETENSIKSSNSEIAVIEKKAERYEELREKTNKTAAETAELKDIAQDLQAILPAGTEIINAQTGAYNSLAGAIENVITSMRQQAVLDAYKDEYSALIALQTEAQDKFDELTQSQLNAGAKLVNDGNDLDYGSFENALTHFKESAEWIKLRDELNKYNTEVEQLESKLQGYYETVQSSATTTGKIITDTAEASRIAAEGMAQHYAELAQEEYKTYEEKLADKVTALDDNLDLRKISEEEYYSQLKQYLDENKNEESKAYFEQLSRYENYCEKKQNEAEKLNASIIKENETAANETAKVYDTQLSEAKKYFDEIHQLYKEGQIDREEYERRVTELCSRYTEQRSELTEYAYSKDSELLKSTLEDITEDYENTLNDIQGKIDSFKSSVSGSFKSMLTFETKEGDALLPSVDEIRKRAEELNMAYSEYMNSDKYREDVKNAHWGREDSYIDKAYATDKIKSSTAELEEYLALIDNLRSRGISDGLISQLQNMSIEEGMATAEYYAGLSDIQLKNLEKNWNKYNETVEKLATELYSEEVDAATDAYLSQVEEKLSECTPEMREAGLKIVQSLVAGFSDEKQAEQVTLRLNEMFGNAKQISETSGYDAGYLFDLKMASGIEGNSQLITDAVNNAINTAFGSMDNFIFKTSADYMFPSASPSFGNMGGDNITNINLSQTNISPKPLGAGEIYRETMAGLTLASMHK